MLNLKESLQFFAHLSHDAIFSQLETAQNGLTETEAKKRLILYGKNVLVEEKRTFLLVEYLSSFKDPLVIILLFAAFASFMLRDTIDAVIIFSIVLISTLLNFTQEFHANQAAKKLKEKVASSATVVRDGEQKEIKTSQLCVGDSILLSAGDLVPADARIIEAHDFFVNQSSLTGESYPVEKDAVQLVSRATALTSLTNIVLSGSSVITGSASAIVLKTGKETEFGKIGSSLSSPVVNSEFAIGVKNFSMLIMRTTIVFVLFVFFFNTVFKHTPLFDSFTFAVALAVGLTPELLPMIMSITMARGSVRMAQKGAIVKHLSAIPNFGSMDVLCTDKTGTLTQAHIELVKYMNVLGNHSEEVLIHAYLNSFYQTGIRNPLDEAVVRFKREDISQYKKIDEIPYDFNRKRMSVVIEKNKKRFLIAKGAPEEIFKIISSYEKENKQYVFNEKMKSYVHNEYHRLSKAGYRVLAVARKEVSHKTPTYSSKDEEAMELLGFIAFLDPAKKDVKDVLARIRAMGIDMKVITGDNEQVTEKICTDVGIEIKGVVLGTQLSTMTDDALRVVVKKTTIFARCSPEDKNRVIHALKAAGHVVGYMGDGINDAPSLHTADVGISVENGVDVAKEASDIILTHKSLKELEAGILEGRRTFGNTMKYIMMGISSNFGNMFSVLGAVIFIPFLPMLSIQILLNNLLYDLSQITLPTDNVDQEFVQTPKRWNIKLLQNFMFTFGPISSLFDFLTFFYLYWVFKLPVHQFQTGWFLESLATQILVIYVIRTRHVPFLQSSPSKYLLLTTLLTLCIGWIIPVTFIGYIFSFQPIPFSALLMIIVIIGSYLFCVELAKREFYKTYYQ